MEITTNTIAELYIKQGYPEKAMDIYRAILELDPANATAREKLQNLEASMKGEEAATAVEEMPAVEADAAVSSMAASSAEPLPVANDVDSQLVRLEDWLGKIKQAGRRT